MSGIAGHFAHSILSGEARGPAPGALRAMTAIASPLYSLTMRLRNVRYDLKLGVKKLPRPVISVGNITTGGTGKTPVVRWLANRLRQAGQRPAVLMRGYKAKTGQPGDEQQMLETLLNSGAAERIFIQADPSRIRGGQTVLAQHPETDVFVLDDAFQHRKLHREVDIVLIDAANPFGYGRVLPRGLLREPLAGLSRAHALLITRASQANELELKSIETRLRRYNTAAPIFRCSHVHTSLCTFDSRTLPLAHLADQRFFAFAGIGNPQSLHAQIQKLPGDYAGHQWFEDHFPFDRQHLRDLRQAATAAGAQLLLTTEKDWVKLAPIYTQDAGELPVLRIELDIQFESEDESELFQLIQSRIKTPSA